VQGHQGQRKQQKENEKASGKEKENNYGDEKQVVSHG
jgi:hypothetical protein